MKNEMKTKVMIVGATFCAALFLFSSFMSCREYLDQKQNAETFEKVAELVKGGSDLPILEPKDGPEPVQEEMMALDRYANVYAQNNDLVGWVSIPDARIDYPVMQTKDNPDFYPKHAFDKLYSNYGVPYAQENCDIGISSDLVPYGHHINNGSMFSDLCKYENEGSYQGYKIIYFDTLESFGEHEVITAFKTVAHSQEELKYYHFVRAGSAKQFNEYITEHKELAPYDIGATAEYGDKFITLSTCEYSRANGRMVVLAELLEE